MMNGVLENGNYQLGQFKFGELRKSEVKMCIRDRVRTGQFAYGPVTSRNGEKISIAY